MILTELCAGSYLLQVEDIGVAWMFNAVPDASKFLIQRKLPINGIVMADSRLQHGLCCNLVEFPLLHALFNRGMIFRGEKPQLVGTSHQLRSAQRGFVRSFYGVTSEAEAERCGLSREQARQLMAEIRGLSINGINPASAYLRTLRLRPLESVPDASTASRFRGLRIHKRDVNVFEVSYGGQREVIDCNIRDGYAYKPPLKIDVKNIPLTLFQVIDTGEEDGFSPKSCMHTVIQWRDKIICVDLPMNASYLLEKISVSRFEIDAVVFTHCHDDHIGDFSMLLQVARKVKVICPRIVWHTILHKSAAVLAIPVRELEKNFDFMPIEYGEELNYSGLRIEAHPSIHPVPCAVYRFSAMVRGQWKTYAHMSDILNFKRCEAMVRAGVIDRTRFEEYRSFLLARADIKKVDVGTPNGQEMISVHGHWRDFINDKSEHIVLGHITEEALDPVARVRVGQMAAPGSSRDLSAEFNYSYLDKYVERAIRLLGDYVFNLLQDDVDVGHVDRDQLLDSIRLLSNQEIRLIQPNTPFLKAGEEATHVDLVVSGIASIWLDGDDGVVRLAGVQAGDVIGEMGVLTGGRRNASILAETYLRVLRIPGQLFREELFNLGIVKDDGHGGIKGILPRIWEQRGVLQRYPMLADGVPLFVQNRIAQFATRRTVARGRTICDNRTRDLIIAVEPDALAVRDDHGSQVAIDTSEAVFGESGILALRTPKFSVQAQRRTEVLVLSEQRARWLRGIPLMRLRFREHAERRVLRLKRSAAGRH